MINNDSILMVIDADTAVGEEVLNIMYERNISCSKVLAVTTKESNHGSKVSFGEQDILSLIYIRNVDFIKINLVIFVGTKGISARYVPKAIKAGCLVIDSNNVFSKDKNVPVVIPEINGDIMLSSYNNANIIISPNSTSVILSLFLDVLYTKYSIKSLQSTVIYSASHGCHDDMNHLYHKSKNFFEASVHNVPSEDHEEDLDSVKTAFNLIPIVGNELDNGYSSEEININNDIKRIIDQNLMSNITVIKAPVFLGTMISLSVEFTDSCDRKSLFMSLEDKGIFSFQEDIISDLLDNNDDTNYSKRIYSSEDVAIIDDIMISRVRFENDNKRLSCCLLANNLRRGSAINIVNIIQLILDSNVMIIK